MGKGGGVVEVKAEAAVAVVRVEAAVRAEETAGETGRVQQATHLGQVEATTAHQSKLTNRKATVMVAFLF
jgi:hypothetical protein